MDIVERQQALWLHRSLLAVAAADCGLVDVLVPRLETSLETLAVPQQDLQGSCQPPQALAVVAFLSALLQPPLNSLPSSLHEFTIALVQHLTRRSGQLWVLLGRTLDRIGHMDEAASQKRAYIRSLLRDCAVVSFASPPDESSCWDFLRSALSEQSSNVSGQVRTDPAALAALVVLAANAGLRQGDNHLSEAVSEAPPEIRKQLWRRLFAWRDPVRNQADLTSWTEVLESGVSGESDCIDDEDADDDFFALSRKQIREEGSGKAFLPPLQVASPPPNPPADAPHPLEHAAHPSRAGLGLHDLLLSAPPEFCCALDGKLLIDPVTSPHGYTFERSVLEKALAASGQRCPLTGEPLVLEDCQRAVQLRLRILRWVRESRPCRPRKS